MLKNFFSWLAAGITGFFSWLRSVFSESDGTGSNSRVISTGLAIVVGGVIITIFHYLTQVKDIAVLSLWLSSIPLIIGALVMLFTAPYGVNKGSGNLSDLINAIKKNNPPPPGNGQ